jgi:hypothetical protein
VGEESATRSAASRDEWYIHFLSLSFFAWQVHYIFFIFSSCSESREDELAKAREGYVAIAEVHKQIKLMNSWHADGLEVL